MNYLIVENLTPTTEIAIDLLLLEEAMLSGFDLLAGRGLHAEALLLAHHICMRVSTYMQST